MTSTNANQATIPQRGIPFMLLMALSVGAVAGVGAWGFRMLIGLIHNGLFLGQFVFEYNANTFTAPSPWGMGVILVPVAGALVVAWLVKNFAPEAKGHGVPEVMDAIYYNEGKIRPRVALVKSLASAISIGSGASVGREGPIVQIGSAFGSTLGALFAMRVSDRVTLIAAGAGAGIAATFNAPLGGMIFAIELLMVSINARNLLLVTTATVVATRISHSLLGTDPSFYVPSLQVLDLHLINYSSLLAFGALGIITGLISVAFIRGLYWMEDVFDAIPGNYYSRHALGMLCVGIMIYLLLQRFGHYFVEGVGYATIMDILEGGLLDPWFLLLLAALKLLATCLSLGSGASGGVFSPALFMGATAGAAFGYLCQAIIPGLDISIATFAIAGMAAVVGGSTGAVLTAIVMLMEMTMDSSVTLPLLVTCTVAYAVRKAIMHDSIYTMKLRARGHSVPQGLHTASLTSQRIGDTMDKSFVVLARDDTTTTEAAVVIREQEGLIVGVYRHTAGQDSVNGDDELHPVRYQLLGEYASPLAAVSAFWESATELVLVSRSPNSTRAEDVLGFVTPDALASVLKTNVGLS